MKINWITAEDIDAWAEKEPRRAQEILPELIAKLIRASSNKIDSLNVPNIQSSGYDGTLVAGEQTNYFPSGKSVWEVGTDKDALGKFKSDIGKRSTDPLLVDISQVEFIFVTLKIWKHRDNPIDKAINEEKQKYTWKDIRILDAHELSRWLDDCPSVAVWLSKAIGIHISGVTSAEHYWDELGNNTNPELTPDCLTIGREHQIETLLKWLFSPTGYLIIRAESSLEAGLFVISTVLKMEEEQKTTLLSRMLIIEERKAWKEILDRANKSSILIPVFPVADIDCPRDICVLFPVSRYDSMGKLDSRDHSIDLPKYNRTQFEELLQLLEYDSASKAKIVIDTKRSFLPLYRKISINPTRKNPKWIDKGDIGELIPAMLAGGWNASLAGDRKVIEILSGMPFDEYMKMLHEWTIIEDAPILIVSSNYYTVSLHEIWTYLFSRITPECLVNIKKSLTDVFSQVDPTFELPEEQWPFASVYGKKHEYTQNVIHGLIISLIMLSERDGQDNYFNIASTKMWVDSVIAQVLEPISTWQHWNTIAPTLPLLAEASPVAVIERLETAVDDNDSDFWKLFNPSKDILWGRNYYTHVLWALEKLVWDEEYVVRAIKLLARIGEREIEYKMTSTPNNSLYEIFCLWCPQNCLDVDERMSLLEIIASSYPAAGWKLLNSIIPTGHSSCMQVSRPRWREFSDRYSDGVPQNEFYSCVGRALDMCLQYAGSDKAKWKDIIEKIDLFWDRFELLSEKIHAACERLSENDIFELCDKLREKISRHREFKDADWSAPEDHVDKWECLHDAIIPDTIGGYRYLLKFNPQTLTPIPYDRKKSTDYEQRSLEIFKLRKTAFEEIKEKFGVEAFLEFCAGAEDTNDWGKIIAEHILEYQYDFNRLRYIRELSQRLYSGLLWVMYSHNGLNVLLCAIDGDKSLTIDEIAEILCCTSLNMDVWTKLEKMDGQVADYYWENVRTFRLQDGDSQAMEYYIDKLLQYKRPFSVINIIAYTKYSNSQTIIKILWRLLELQEHVERNGLSISAIQPHQILDLFERLYNDFNIDDMEVAKLEIAYMPYFSYDGEPKCLIRCITKTPDFYIEFISKSYSADDDDGTNTVFSVPEHVVRTANKVLEKFNEIPGCNTNLINEDVFVDWMQRAKRAASESGYTNAFESCVGRLLSYSPNGSDGIFPHEIVRNYLEEHSSEPLIRNFIIGKRNQRGTYNITWGVDEKAIAQKYKDNAFSIRIKYPKTASILGELSKYYLADAHREQMMEYGDFSFGY